MFTEQFAFHPHALVNFVGAGGKTALIHRLMREDAVPGPVLCTATTRMHPPDPGEGFSVIAADNPDLLRQLLHSVVRNLPAHSYKLVATRSFLSPTLLRGVPPDFAHGLTRESFAVLLNEADGAAGFSLKMPKDSEPVLMENASYLVPVLGFDCLNRPIGADVIFRWEIFMEHFPEQSQGIITPQLAVDILMHPRGVCRGYAPGMTIIPFINKVDSPEQDAAARDLAQRIFRNGNFPVERVLFGSAHHQRVESVSAA